jgi:hypothetical protein
VCRLEAVFETHYETVMVIAGDVPRARQLCNEYGPAFVHRKGFICIRVWMQEKQREPLDRHQRPK